MDYNNLLFKEYKKDNTSQYGEDGMIEEILRRLDISSGVAVDLGAWDGKAFSNVFTLLTKGFNIYGVEKTDRAIGMFKLKEIYPNLFPMQVGIERDKGSINHINKILDRLNVPKEVDVFNIDIDSIDPWVFEDVNRDVKLYIVEIEPRYWPFDMIYNNPNGNAETNPPQNLTGFGPMYQIAKKKGYTLIGMSIINCFFLRNDLLDKLKWPEVTNVPELTNFNPLYLSEVDKKRWKEYDNN